MPIITITGSFPSKPMTTFHCPATPHKTKKRTYIRLLTNTYNLNVQRHFPTSSSLRTTPLKPDPLLAKKKSQVPAIPSFTLIKNNHGISSSSLNQPYLFFCLPQQRPLLSFSLSTTTAINSNRLITSVAILSTPLAHTRLKPSFTSSHSTTPTGIAKLQPITPYNNPSTSPLHH